MMGRNTAWMVAAGLLTVLFSAAAVAAELPGRLTVEQADSIAASTDDPWVASDALSRAWEHQRAMDVLTASGRNDAGTLWRLARAHVDLGENMEEESDQEAAYEQALELARQAIALDSTCADAHLQAAIACGRLSLIRGVFGGASGLVKQGYRHALVSASLADMPVALYVVGRTHKKLMEKSRLIRMAAGFGFADDDSVRIYFDRSLASADNQVQLRVEYADWLIKERDEDDLARRLLEEALSMPLRDEHDTEAQVWARELLEELE